MANDRINNYINEKDVFDKEMALHIVKETFAERKAKGKWKNKV